MSDQSENILIPAQFAGVAMSQLTRDVVRRKPAANVWPDRIVFDFQNLRFIRPAGVVFLHNMIKWLQAKRCKVAFVNHKLNRAAINYLRDSLFFHRHIDSTLLPNCTCRQSTQPLVDIRHEKSNFWIRETLIPWVARESNTNEASLYGLQSSMTELFNNILDHSRYDIGSVFGQHFPSEHLIIIALSDMGRGIPINVRNIKPDISDCDAILEAVKEGFTTGSIPTNAGMGLDQLMRSVVIALQGQVTIYSGKGIVKFGFANGAVEPCLFDKIGFCPGTTIEIGINTRTIPELTDEEGDLQW